MTHMQPLFDSCHVTTHKNQKRFDSQRVIEIFKLVVQPTHNAFISALPKPLCTSSDLIAATAAHEKAERQIESSRRFAERQASRQSMIEKIAKTLKSRFILKNSNNSKAYLMPEGFSPDKQYTNAYGIRNMKIDPTLKHRIASECSNLTIDTFVFESVTRWNAHSIIDQYEEKEIA